MMKTTFRWFFILQCLSRGSVSQQVGTHLLEETHPTIKIQKCTREGVCVDRPVETTLDADMRLLQEMKGTTSCSTGKGWNTTICPDSEICAENGGLGGVKYKKVHGILARGHHVNLKLFNHGQLRESRIYLMDKNKYKLFYLKNRESTFDVNASKLPCGVNAALYFTSMSADGDLSSRNRAGATYGTGYCDAQCPTSLRFIDGKANIESHAEFSNHTSSRIGACCTELDLWEGNALAHAYTAHPCVFPGMTICDGEDCKARAGLCDHAGCGLVSQRWGGQNLSANPSMDTTSKFTVVAQFHTSDGNSHGELVEIKQFYVQHGVLIQHQSVELHRDLSFESITEKFCLDLNSMNASQPDHEFQRMGGLQSIGRAMDAGMVLVMSLWTDEMSNNLGSIQKVPATKKIPGSSYERLCPQYQTIRPFIQKHFPHASASFSNIKIGPINSTWSIATIDRPHHDNKLHTTT